MNKSIKLTVAILALTTATTAFAQTSTQDWTGNSGTVGVDGCEFSNRTGANTGQMERLLTSGNENTWNTSRRGFITVIARGQSSVTLTNDSKLYTTTGQQVEGIVATVDYMGLGGTDVSSIQKRGSSVASATSESLAVTNLSSVHGASQVNFSIKGTVTMTTTGTLNGQEAVNGLDNNTDYKVIHTVTCVSE